MVVSETGKIGINMFIVVHFFYGNAFNYSVNDLFLLGEGRRLNPGIDRGREVPVSNDKGYINDEVKNSPDPAFYSCG